MTTAPWPSVDTATCNHCGPYVSGRFCHVCGDNNDRAHRCEECDSYRRLTRGSASGVTVSIPDPETAVGHHEGGADVWVRPGESAVPRRESDAHSSSIDRR